MKTKLTALIVVFLTCGHVGFTQESPKPETPPPTSGTIPAPTAVPTTPPKPDEVVPLIVIDEVPLADAIRNLARQSGINFQFDPRVTSSNQPNISIRFENVSAMEALVAVLDNYGLLLVKDPRSKIARITLKDPKAEDPLVTKVIELKYCDATNMVDVLKPTLSPRSKILADTRTRQVLVTATEKEMENVLQLINRLDAQTKQVLIEAQIYETAKNPTTMKGIDWSGTLEGQRVTFGNNSSYTLPPTAPTITPDAVNGGVSVTPGYAGALSGVLQDPRVLLNTANGFSPAIGFLNADGASAVISFLNKDSDTEVVATPRAVTLDNQMAQLSVTRAYPIFQITPGSANSPAGATVTYTNLGTILSVTPRIAADNNISMRVVPEVSNIDGKDQQTINGTLNVANIYAIRRIETHVMIPSGNTLVMGGLINDTTTKAYTKVPILGDAPILGLAFRSEKKSRQKQNLLIFVTPTVLQQQDFHVSSTGTDFLQNQLIEDRDDNYDGWGKSWNSGKPKDWTKPKEPAK